ncbi:uncharacterized protein KY384_005143 [Bacidia gigantensis]|uniref:uncharacterized protein n=1 Tax=Bacidia gigantensis TaxID=2732470 RepID=UPI001D051E6A|nr:uncharacterized protein KY384_005143 [Bacidia gigantensis]KAG8529662.1 hypothetical protein KY384_005143 [Bacidia gigantensis]
MAAPIGISVGDFILVGRIAGTIISELKKSSETAARYQNLLVELETLSRALTRLNTLKPTEHDLVHLDAVRAAVAACKRPLEDFLKKLSTYDKALGVQNAEDTGLKGVKSRLRFSLTLDEDVKELRATLTSHASTINMLLLGQILESLTIAEADRATNVEMIDQVRVQLEAVAQHLQNPSQHREAEAQITGDDEPQPADSTNGQDEPNETSLENADDKIAESLLELDNAVNGQNVAATSSPKTESYSEINILDIAFKGMSLALSASAIVSMHKISSQVDMMVKNNSAPLTISKALDILRYSKDPPYTVIRFFERKRDEIWAALESAPTKYVMNKDEYGVINYYHEQKCNHPLFKPAIARFWANYKGDTASEEIYGAPSHLNKLNKDEQDKASPKSLEGNPLTQRRSAREDRSDYESTEKSSSDENKPRKVIATGTSGWGGGFSDFTGGKAQPDKLEDKRSWFGFPRTWITESSSDPYPWLCSSMESTKQPGKQPIFSGRKGHSKLNADTSSTIL